MSELKWEMGYGYTESSGLHLYAEERIGNQEWTFFIYKTVVYPKRKWCWDVAAATLDGRRHDLNEAFETLLQAKHAAEELLRSIKEEEGESDGKQASREKKALANARAEVQRVLDNLQYEYDATDNRKEAALYLNAINGVKAIARALEGEVEE